jgi:hypothetical protein
MTSTDPPKVLPTAWGILHQGLQQRRPVRVRYHDRLRVVCPHVLGWKNGRAKALVYQTAIIGTTSHDPRGWRSLFVDEIEEPTMTDERWQSAPNYTPDCTSVDILAAAVTSQQPQSAAFTR